MRDYELMVVLAPEFGEEGAEPVLQRVQDLVKNNGGEIQEVNDWGLRRLAYEINDYRDGYYTVITFDGDPERITELERSLRLTEQVIRYLVVRVDEE